MSAGRVVPVVLSVLVAAANGVVFTSVTALPPMWLAWTIAGPLVVGVVAAALPARAPVDVPAAAAPTPASDSAALHLLGALQEGGRLIDFLLEDVGAYSDEQIGAAVRSIHDPCRAALRRCLAIEPVMRGSEGDTVTVAAGFDPSAVRLVGNVSGQAPFSGALRHSGWRVTAVTIPAPKGRDPRVLAPAEVELP
jgi:uncharacterized protein DUF2760